jgi:head-tail adaptor
MRQRLQFLRPAAAVVNGETVETFTPAFRVWGDVSIPTVKGQLGEMALAGGAEASKTVYRIQVSRLPEEVTARWRVFLGLKQCEIVACEKTADKGAIFTYILAREVY